MSDRPDDKTADLKSTKNTDQQNAAAPFDAKSFLASCSNRSGIYQMFDSNQKPLYIGKAKNLKKRLASYFRKDLPSARTALMVSKIAHIDVTVTQSETEALILERNLINRIRPPYNVIFRDDKSYPYIFLSDHPFPRLSYYRGSKKQKGRYFGPFPSSQAVRESLNLLQKVFKVRQCEDSFFNNRSRPCLQYQIGRCSGPCVEVISADDYAQSVRQSVMFIEGKNDDLGKELQTKMQTAADAMRYEEAAVIRDQISYLRRVQESQYVENSHGNTDIIASAVNAGHACVQVLYVRRGRMLGSRSYYPKPGLAESEAELVEAFITHQYLDDSGGERTPSEIITHIQLPNETVLAQTLREANGKKLSLTNNVRGNRARWLAMAHQTASQNLTARLNNRQQIETRFDELQNDLELESPPQRIECFDISHSSGELTVASCVVFEREGAKKSEYRRFNIDGITPGDDYAAMQQALLRRYRRIKKGEVKLPDILLIDGGKGQITQALETLDELEIEGVLVVGVAKGSSRKPGLETLYIGSHDNALTLPNDASSLHLIQQVRDEAHRFAITGHRARRSKKRQQSPLEGIAGVGPKRRQQLLRHFGGWQEIERASIDELAKTPGISRQLAEEIHAVLHR